MNDDTPTPARTPSAMQRLGLVTCPKCHGSGLDVGAELERLPCDLCNGGMRVAVDVGIAWTLEHGDTEPPTANG